MSCWQIAVEKKRTRAIGIQDVDALQVRAACTRCPMASNKDLLATRNADVLYTRASGIRRVDALQVRAARTGRPKAFTVDLLETFTADVKHTWAAGTPKVDAP